MERSSAEMVDGILDGMRWLGLDWDEGPGVGGPHAPYFQSERYDRYRAAAEQLVAAGHAYYDFAHPTSTSATGGRGDGTCETGATTARAMRCRRSAAPSWPPAERARRSASWCPPGRRRSRTSCTGRSQFDNAHIEDFVMLRSRRRPDLSPVGGLRRHRHGDHARRARRRSRVEHAEAGAALPGARRRAAAVRARAAHPGRRQEAAQQAPRRHLGDGVRAPGLSARGDGELPGAARLVARRRRELFFDPRELVRRFSLEGISSGNAVFNTEKLDWMNSQHIMHMPTPELARRLEPLMRRAGVWSDAVRGRAA